MKAISIAARMIKLKLGFAVIHLIIADPLRRAYALSILTQLDLLTGHAQEKLLCVDHEK